MTQELILRYDPQTIKHLGVSLYSQLPSVLSELISNAYDADATEVTIELIDSSPKEITICDNGVGMSFDELNNKYLLVGRNRRQATSNQYTEKLRRPVIGKKGLGKLSVFGVCKEVEIETVKDGLLNHFSMNLDDIESSTGEYKPILKKRNVSVKNRSYTKIFLKKIKRKTPFDFEGICENISKKFTIFDQMKTSFNINGGKHVFISNETKFEKLDKEFEWTFPDSNSTASYINALGVVGKIITTKTPVRDTKMRGIYLTSRGKIVNESEFYGARENDQFHSYVTGYLSIDFIDEFEEDIISTDRSSLIWETDEANNLRIYLQEIIRKVGNEWRRKRGESKAKRILEDTGTDIQKWKNQLPSYEKDLANKLVDPILEDANIPDDRSSSLITGVIDQFENKNFKEYASELAETVTSTELPKIIRLMNEWKVTENKELSSLAVARIEVINKFEELLSTDAKEVPVLHQFLKKFSWLLDPRILEFDDEVRYTKILKANFPDEKLNESDKRIDFLCSNALGGILYVIEIKRGGYVVDTKAIEQAYSYGVFLKDKYATPEGFSNVVCFVVGGSKSQDGLFKSKESTYLRTGEVFVKTYTELLEQSKKYHNEFIQAHRSFNKS